MLHRQISTFELRTITAHLSVILSLRDFIPAYPKAMRQSDLMLGFIFEAAQLVLRAAHIKSTGIYPNHFHGHTGTQWHNEIITVFSCYGKSHALVLDNRLTLRLLKDLRSGIRDHNRLLVTPRIGPTRCPRFVINHRWRISKYIFSCFRRVPFKINRSQTAACFKCTVTNRSYTGMNYYTG